MRAVYEVALERRAVEGATEDGSLALLDGRVRFTAPRGRGRYPVIRPGAHTRVLVNGSPVTRAAVVMTGDQVSVEPVDDPPVTDVSVDISRDGLTASLVVSRRPGTRYRLVDRGPAADLTVLAVPDADIPPPGVTVQQLEAALSKAGVVFGIDRDGLLQLAAALDDASGGSDERMAVAFGNAPEPGVDGHVELLFESAPLVPVEAEGDRVDLLGLYRLSTVEAGDLLAIKHPPREGRPGRTVTGKEIPVSKPRPARMIAGKGAAMDEAQTRILATRGGRPCFQRGIVSVRTVHTVAGDVGPASGHVEFRGDVVVSGDVSESMRVVAAGKVTVGGVVSGAYVEADEGVVVGRSIVRSRVVAGGRLSNLAELLATLRTLERELDTLVAAVHALKDHPRFRTADLQKVGDGPLVKLLLERKFSGLGHDVTRLGDLVRQAGPALEGDFHDFVARGYSLDSSNPNM